MDHRHANKKYLMELNDVDFYYRDALTGIYHLI